MKARSFTFALFLAATCFATSAAALATNEYVAYCPEGNQNTSTATDGQVYTFQGKTRSGKTLKTPGFRRLCTNNSRNCIQPTIINGRLTCRYVANDIAPPATFVATQPFQSDQQAKATALGAKFIKLH